MDDDRDASQAQDGRRETEVERLDRNWNDLLQELRVIQTGVQLLTGFLLTLPFQQRFTTLSDTERDVYLATAASSIAATVFLQAPVIVHRAVFRQHRRKETVMVAHRLAIAGMALLGLAIIGVAYLISSVVLGSGYGLGAAACALVLLLALWVTLPAGARSRSTPDSK
jgi:O-antigen/teichoic acid export membrane protein